MRLIVSALLLAALAACEPPAQLRQVTLADPPALGLSLHELPAAALRSVGLSYGLAVAEVGSVGERAGLRVGDIVYGVNRERIRNLDDFRRLVAERVDDTLALLVRRGGSDVYVALDLAAQPPEEPWPSRGTLLRT
ncbi:MAG TPA: PDZ domain-containing protein [Burkholderiales bacterium]|nr:PDZ domain-containing protein [Burkholderiales bacterium]